MNHFLRALRNLWTVLDGRHAPNPVRDVPEAIEDDPGPRALPYPIVTAILDALPDVTRPVKGGSVPAGSQTKARLTVMAWTGVAQSQLMRLRPEDVDLAGRTILYTGPAQGPWVDGCSEAHHHPGRDGARAVRRTRLLGSVLSRLDAT